MRRLAESMQLNEYPPGIVNPAFTDMFLWELRTGHPCNHYMIPRESNIRKGLVFRGNTVYVYTPILNNDITSFTKIIVGKAPKLSSK